MNQHTVKAYGDELNQITAEVARMGGLAEAQVADAIDSVARRDIALARAVVERDLKLDALHRDIEKKAIRLIALRQPVASDLRRTLGAMKIATDLERTGDLAKNIAKRALILAEGEPMQPLTRSIERMGRLVSTRLRDVLDAYTASELDRAVAVWQTDDEVDEHYNALFRELLTYMMGDPRTIGACTHLLFMAKNLERIGDHATNIAEDRPLRDHRRRHSGRTPARPAHGRGFRSDAEPFHALTRDRRPDVQPYILVMEDEDALATLLQYNLEKEGYDVTVAADGEEGMLQIDERQPDLVLLDWMLPKLSGIEVCRRIRGKAETRNLPIIMLTARGEESDRVRGLDTGADDYLTKPFSMVELIARIRAVLRRIRPGLADDRLNHGDIIIDRVSHRVKRDGKEVHLGPTEFRLLDHFMQHPGRVFSREQLLDAVWGSDVYVEARTVDVHVGRLRKALSIGDDSANPIRTVRSAGYSLDLEG